VGCLACPNSLARRLTQHNGQGLDHSTVHQLSTEHQVAQSDGLQRALPCLKFCLGTGSWLYSNYFRPCWKSQSNFLTRVTWQCWVSQECENCEIEVWIRILTLCMCIHVSGSWWTVSKSSASGGLVLFHAYSEAFKAVHQISPFPSICFHSTILCCSFVLWTISVSSLIKTNCYSKYGLIENSISGKNLLWFVIVNLCVGCYMISSQMATMLKHLE
jgi:hypothetical protein